MEAVQAFQCKQSGEQWEAFAVLVWQPGGRAPACPQRCCGDISQPSGASIRGSSGGYKGFQGCPGDTL
eukprot:1156905-Pelagomonas_calceolata.AAC.5